MGAIDPALTMNPFLRAMEKSALDAGYPGKFVCAKNEFENITMNRLYPKNFNCCICNSSGKLLRDPFTGLRVCAGHAEFLRIAHAALSRVVGLEHPRLDAPSPNSTGDFLKPE
jgi:hypothetical protein